jgi:hypothetical protein
MFMSDWSARSALMTPPPPPRRPPWTTSVHLCDSYPIDVSHATQFQFSLSAAALDTLCISMDPTNPAGFYVDTSLARGCARAMDSMIMRMFKQSQILILQMIS